MKYLLDSGMITKLATAEGGVLHQRAPRCFDDDMVTSSSAIAEVLDGSVSEKPSPILELAMFLDFDMAAAQAFGTLPIKRASHDRLIAAHALSFGSISVTDNEDALPDEPGLLLENWTRK